VATDRPTVFVTGAASGIGRASALLFAERGWRVGLFDVDEDRLAEVAAKAGPDAVAAHLDVRDLDQWRGAVEHFGEATGGRMDVLLNNAGVAAAGWFEDVPPDVARGMVEVNLLGAMNGVYACLELLKATPGARIVQLGSVMGLHGPPQGAVYGATKAALRSLTESLDLELERHGVRVVVLQPGVVDTPLIDTPAYSDTPGSLRDGIVEPAERVAEAVVRALDTGRVHLVVGRGTGLWALLCRLSPGLVHWLLRRLLRARVGDGARR